MKNSKIKYFFVTVCLTIFTMSLYAQDLIVTSENDSINCKITKVKSDYIYFVCKYKEETRNTLLPVNKVAYYQLDYYPTAEVPAEEIQAYKSYPHFKVAVSGGWGYRIAPIANDVPPEFVQYVKGLKSGFHYNAALSYYFNKHLGIGLKYNGSHSGNEMDNIYLINPDSTIEYGKMSDKIMINLILPYFTARFLSARNDNCLFLEAGFGYMGYRDRATIVSQELTYTGFTIGLCGTVGYDFAISQDWAIGFQLSLITGSISQFKVSGSGYTGTIDLKQYEGLSRIDLSVGLRFNK
jgi:hypothetical protein